jgi:hypothetical protein
MSNSDDPGARSFTKFLADLGDGYTARGLSEDLRTMEVGLNNQAIQTGATAKGELVIKLKFKTEANGVCTVTPDVKMTLPKKPTMGGVMWHDPKTGHLSASNPKQLELGKLREVPRVPGKRDDEGSGN